ncbi:MAG TPA: SDR family NAD(P)-dependent oxidoreductase [Anaerolineae bacterium]|nr:SDR family NAD(P)-dependent oxidoreductase [Anaerolineae bacterium]
MNLKQAKILITGASSGIGAATAKAAAREGAYVILLARNSVRLEQVATEIRQIGERAAVYPIDLTDADAVTQTVQQIQQEVGTPDVLMNNAGVGRWLSVEETQPEEAAMMMAAPYLAAFNITRAFLPEMLKHRSGTIVNMTSIAAYLVWPGATAYTAGRWAMRGFHQALTADLSGTRLRTMLVAFAAVRSDYWANNPGSKQRIPQAQTMIPTLTPDQAASAIVHGLQRNQREVFAPFMLRVILTLNYFFPFVTRRLMIHTGYKRSAAAAIDRSTIPS